MARFIMRLTFLTTLCMIVLYNGFPGAARAEDYPWCVATLEGRTDCSFYTYEQCKATASGIGGCFRNKSTLAFPRYYSGWIAGHPLLLAYPALLGWLCLAHAPRAHLRLIRSWLVEARSYRCARPSCHALALV